jgi:aspartyl-tRNA(Asn)/glutamyl-tRNA(Gln) amidotransferase subunit A
LAPAIHDLSLFELRKAILARELSPEDAVRSSLERIESLDGRLRAFLHVDRDGAVEAAGRSAKPLMQGGTEPGFLHGIPVALKDNIICAGMPATCGSKILEEYKPPCDSTAASLLRGVGAIIAGKTNMDEFSMGSSTEQGAFGPCLNPWGRSRVPGGSSGGSAAAVAARMVHGALGTDTGGGVRQPASFCGVVGLRPTYGRVSRHGLAAFSSSLDQIGPMTRDVRDCAMLLEAIAGRDPLDSTSIPTPVPDFMQVLDGDVKGLRVGVPSEYFGPFCDTETAAAVKKAVSALEGLGCRTVETSLPHTEFAPAAYHVISSVEASSNLARYDGVRYGAYKPAAAAYEVTAGTRSEFLGIEVKRRILLGVFALTGGRREEYYLKAQKVRSLVHGDFMRAFKDADLLACPVSPTPAFKQGERTRDPAEMYTSDVYTIPASLAGLPAISVPCGISAEGLPIGLQLIGRPFDEETVLRAAYAYEQSAGWGMRAPVP